MGCADPDINNLYFAVFLMGSHGNREKNAVLALLSVILVGFLLAWVFSGGCSSSEEYPVTPSEQQVRPMLPLDSPRIPSDSISRDKKKERKSSGKQIPKKTPEFAPSSPLEHPVKRKSANEP